MLRINEGGDATSFLSLCDSMDSESRLTRRLRTIDLDDTPFGITSHAKSRIQSDTSCRNHLYILYLLVSHSHDAALAEILLNLRHGGLQGFHFLLLRVHSRALFHFFFCHSCANI